jgi:hypothetical protein
MIDLALIYVRRVNQLRNDNSIIKTLFTFVSSTTSPLYHTFGYYLRSFKIENTASFSYLN